MPARYSYTVQECDCCDPCYPMESFNCPALFTAGFVAPISVTATSPTLFLDVGSGLVTAPDKLIRFRGCVWYQGNGAIAEHRLAIVAGNWELVVTLVYQRGSSMVVADAGEWIKFVSSGLGDITTGVTLTFDSASTPGRWRVNSHSPPTGSDTISIVRSCYGRCFHATNPAWVEACSFKPPVMACSIESSYADLDGESLTVRFNSDPFPGDGDAAEGPINYWVGSKITSWSRQRILTVIAKCKQDGDAYDQLEVDVYLVCFSPNAPEAAGTEFAPVLRPGGGNSYLHKTGLVAGCIGGPVFVAETDVGSLTEHGAGCSGVGAGESIRVHLHA